MLKRLYPALLASVCLCSTWACATPKPRAPEAVTQLEEKKRPSPLIVKLKLGDKSAQKVELLFAKVRAYTQNYEAARVALINEALPQIRSGQLNYERLKPFSDRAITEWEAIVPRLALDANELHAILKPKQRKRLVKILGGGDPDLSEEEKREARKDRIAKVLDLNAGQKTRVFGTLVTLTMGNYSLVTDTRAAITEAKEAFVQDEYDARKLKVVTDLDLHAIAELAYEALEDGLEILTPEQRLTLVAILEARLLRRTTESATAEDAETVQPPKKATAKEPTESASQPVIESAAPEPTPPAEDKQKDAPVEPVERAIKDPSAAAPPSARETPQQADEGATPESQKKTINRESK